MLKKYLPAKVSVMKCLFIIGCMLLIYILDNLSISALANYRTYMTYLLSLLWIGLACLIYLLPRLRPKAALKHKESVIWWSFNFGVINIIILIIAGLVDGFGKSPYNHTPMGMLHNFFVVGSMLVGRETARYYIVNSLTNKEKYTVFLLTALLMTAISYPINTFFSFKSNEDMIMFTTQYIAADFCQNLLATYLAFLGGWGPALLYTSVLQAFHWFSPVLPDLKWITSALIGIICPIFSLIAMQNIYLKESKAIKRTGKNNESPLSWMITSIVSICIIWFSVGVFPIYPSVIATGSMIPVIRPGDMIIIEKITKNEDMDRLKVGDVIQFKRGNIFISHRIIGIMESNGAKCYRTKGDNNTSPDSKLVTADNIRGRIRYVIPKIGWPTLLFKQRQDVHT